MIIKEITLLTVTEYEKYKPIIPYVAREWWLQNSENFFKAYIVTLAQNTVAIAKSDLIWVRPVLIVEDLIAFPENKINLFGLTWTVLDGNSNRTILLCDSTIYKHRFCNNECTFLSSDLKNLLDNWLSEKIADTEIAIKCSNKTEFLLLQSLCKKYNLNELYSILFADNKYLVYSPYQHWKITPEIPARTKLSFSEFCEYISEQYYDSSLAFSNFAEFVIRKND